MAVITSMGASVCAADQDTDESIRRILTVPDGMSVNTYQNNLIREAQQEHDQVIQDGVETYKLV